MAVRSSIGRGLKRKRQVSWAAAELLEEVIHVGTCLCACVFAVCGWSSIICADITIPGVGVLPERGQQAAAVRMIMTHDMRSAQ